MTNAALAELSDNTVAVAILLYAVAMLAFAGEQAARASARTTTRREAALAARRAAAERTRVMVGAGGPPPAAPPAPAEGVVSRVRSRAGRIGMAFTVAGIAVHLVSVVARGLSVDRVPWGNMYEFSSAVTLSASVIFVVLVARGTVDRGIGAFVMLPVVLSLGLAATVLYTPAGPLVPALDSYWIRIHVFAAVLCTGAFLLSGVVAGLYLLRAAYDARGGSSRFPLSMGATLPSARSLDRASYAVIAFAFPLWTFAIIA
ncbi:MAG TPA: cytochrome c biogenesis protein CcsA, partial [Mycobacteriales bacterium]|nr:cytochrome c biogenesis protein CcsA [Mycobacteriales bacterium]